MLKNGKIRLIIFTNRGEERDILYSEIFLTNFIGSKYQQEKHHIQNFLENNTQYIFESIFKEQEPFGYYEVIADWSSEFKNEENNQIIPDTTYSWSLSNIIIEEIKENYEFWIELKENQKNENDVDIKNASESCTLKIKQTPYQKSIGVVTMKLDHEYATLIDQQVPIEYITALFNLAFEKKIYLSELFKNYSKNDQSELLTKFRLSLKGYNHS